MIGVGGGGLLMFWSLCYPEWCIEGVELDSVVIGINSGLLGLLGLLYTA